MNPVKAWLLASRPKTLTAAVVPIVVGTSLLKVLGQPVQIWISVLALLSSLFIQIGTNFVNDVLDFRKGADTETRLGPTRVTASGIFSQKTVAWASAFCFLMALICGVPLALHGGMPIVMIGLVSIFFGYGYTGGPFPLAYLGLGDLFVILFFGLVAVTGLVFLQTGAWPIEAIVAGLQIGFHCTILIAINNLRDVNQDVLVGKKTLPVRFGKKFARYEIAFLALAPFVLQAFWLGRLNWISVLLPFLSLPLALKIIKLVFQTEPSRVYNDFLGKSAGLHMMFGLLLSAGFLI